MLAPTALSLAVFAARIAIVSSSNEADGQATLRYAARDGQRVAAVLAELGAFAPADVWQLPDATAASLRAALDKAEEAAAREPGSSIVFYYSGHADAEGLLLGSERFPYRELRERLARSSAQVRVALLDACNSGGATTPKGGRPGVGASFASADPLRVQGAAILAASGAQELAQESGEIDGSYFTHHLVSGLRGAGDRDGNGVVTLGEAYAYVYAHTLAATVPSLWGPQHPSYDYRLSGTGDLVLTSLQREKQALTFPASSIEGAYTVLDAHREVVGEVHPAANRRVRLALPPGRYRVSLRASGRLAAADVSLSAGADSTVERSAMKDVGTEYAFAKGGEVEGRHGVFVDFGLLGSGPSGTLVSSELGLTYRWSGPRWSLAPRVSYGEANLDEVDWSYRLRRLTGAAYVLRRLTNGALDVRAGAGASVTRATQQTSSGRELHAVVPGVAGVLALELPIIGGLAARLAWDAGIELVPVDGDMKARPLLRAVLGLGWRL